jgi:hypothetical protein
MTRQYFRITGHDELRRDTESLGIVNVDKQALNKFKEEREHKRKLSQIIAEHEELKNDVGELKNDMGEIKSMLAQIFSKIVN